MKCRQLWFTRPRQVEVREQQLPEPESSQVLVESTCSAISAGTELLVYRDQIPAGMALDASLDSLKGTSRYPLQYGYACAGRVIGSGAGVDTAWLGRRVFSFQPHASHFIATPGELLPIPDDIDDEAAVFLPNMETAVNLVLDAAPLLGERVVVLGQGIVGLLTAGLLGRFPLAQLHALDRIALRRDRAGSLGASQAWDPASDSDLSALKAALRAHPAKGADLVIEVSGNPETLNLAIELCGYGARIIIGSWYGDKASPVNLGGAAHRNRIRLVTSQVSTIAPELGARWDKTRRYAQAWDGIRQLQPQTLVTHRQPLERAGDIYEVLDTTPEQALQAVFTYDAQDG